MILCGEVKAMDISGSPTQLKTGLTVTLQWLAGSHHINHCSAFELTSSAFAVLDQISY